MFEIYASLIGIETCMEQDFFLIQSALLEFNIQVFFLWWLQESRAGIWGEEWCETSGKLKLKVIRQTDNANWLYFQYLLARGGRLSNRHEIDLTASEFCIFAKKISKHITRNTYTCQMQRIDNRASKQQYIMGLFIFK